ncbi:MAG: hypothetical protein IJK98_05595, partial [Clostridia bacterium]|nr:hypothetical protein [Clostridia bacterium]
YTDSVQIRTATDLSYSILRMIGRDNIKWTKLKGVSETYSSGLVIISNTGDDGSLISATNLKWTFKNTGMYPKNPNGTFMVTIDKKNVSSMKKVLAFARKDLTVLGDSDTSATYADGAITMTVTTADTVESLVVKNSYGDVIDEALVDTAFEDLGNGQRQWTVTVTESEDGDYSFFICAESDRLISGNSFRVDVSVDNPPEDDSHDFASFTIPSLSEIMARLRSMWLRFIDLLKMLLSAFGVQWN